jgi:hypothetical protein
MIKLDEITYLTRINGKKMVVFEFESLHAIFWHCHEIKYEKGLALQKKQITFNYEQHTKTL